MRYKILHKMQVDGNTLLTIEGPIKPIKIGDTINNGIAKLLSIAMINRDMSQPRDNRVSLLVSGDFRENELII